MPSVCLRVSQHQHPQNQFEGFIGFMNNSKLNPQSSIHSQTEMSLNDSKIENVKTNISRAMHSK